mgnify:CR=1 FL=1
MVAENFPSGSPAKASERSSPARRIAGVFLRAAMGPVEYAGGCILGNKIITGLEELGPDGLLGAFHRGVTDVAALAAVPRSEVEGLLPMGDVAALEARLRQTQPRALIAWRTHAGQFGFLDVMTALTIDGRRPEIGLCLERVAGKVRQDRHLAEPLEALGTDVTAWEDLIVRCRHILEDRGWLARALRRRVMKRVIIGGIAFLVLVAATIAIVTVRIKRDDVARKVAAVADCDADKLTEADLEWANSEQRAVVSEKADSCTRAQAEEAARRKREKEALAAEKLLREAREAREKECALLADDIEKGSLSEASKKKADKAADLLDRVAKKALTDADAGPIDPVFPCAEDAAIKKRIEAAFADALMVDPLLWARRSDPSPTTAALLLAHKDALPDNGLIGLADNAERSAKSSLARGDIQKMATAKRLCGLAKSLGVAGHASCNAIEKLP